MQDAAAAAAVAAAGMQKITCRRWGGSALLPTVGLCLSCSVPSHRPRHPLPGRYYLLHPAMQARPSHLLNHQPLWRGTYPPRLYEPSGRWQVVEPSRCAGRFSLSLPLTSPFFFFSAQIMLQSGCNLNIENTPRCRHLKISTPGGYLCLLEDQRVTLLTLHLSDTSL